MSKIETGRYSERLRRQLGMKGTEKVSGELSPEISPVFILEDNTIEWAFLQQVRKCGAGVLQVGTAGQETLIRLVNPAASGVIAVFTHVDVQMNKNVSCNFGYSTSIADLATAAATAVYDHRWSPAAQGTTVIGTRTSAGGTISLTETVFVTRMIVDTSYLWDGPFVLLPGEGVEFGAPGTLDLDVRMNARWTERQLPALEE